MSLSILLPLMLNSASTGLTCGLSCGACGTPAVNVFLASYLFTHTGKTKRSLVSFAGFHIGKAVTVAVLCAIISWFGTQITDINESFYGISLESITYVIMLVFTVVMIIKWVKKYKKKPDCSKCDGCESEKKRDGFLPMVFYGLISGMSPCTSLVIVLGYAASMTAIEAILIGLCFSLANSVIPLILLVILTGALSKEMFREIPTKIKYFQLATYLIFAVALVYNLVSAVFWR